MTEPKPRTLKEALNLLESYPIPLAQPGRNLPQHLIDDLLASWGPEAKPGLTPESLRVAFEASCAPRLPRPDASIQHAMVLSKLLATGREPLPAWVPCPCCENHLCTIHGGHAHDCACPSLEFWDSELGLNPYEEGGHLSLADLEALKEQHGYVEE